MDSVDKHFAKLKIHENSSSTEKRNFSENINNCSRKFNELDQILLQRKEECEKSITNHVPIQKQRISASSYNPNKSLHLDEISQIKNTYGDREVTVGKLPILLRKQPAYEQQQNIYSNIKMTLDNPQILDQQLEALEYHKKQLEKKGLLSSSSTKKNPTNVGPPKLSSASYVNGELVAAIRSSPSVKMMAEVLNENHLKQQQQQKENLKGKPILQQNMSNEYSENQGNDKKQFMISHNNVYSNIKNSMSSDSNQSKHNIMENKSFDPENHQTSSCILSSNFYEPCSSVSAISSSIGTRSNSEFSGYNVEDEFTLPPSPVSSSYSELRRAADNCSQIQSYPTVPHQSDLECLIQSKQNPHINTSYNDYSMYSGPNTQSFSQSSLASDYYCFGSGCQGSSTYESIYEPITINPSNRQTTSKPNLSLYTSYENVPRNGNSINRKVLSGAVGNGVRAGVGAGGSEILSSISPNIYNLNKDNHNFNDLVLNPGDSGTDLDSYGFCVKCGERIVGENSGCTAMDQVYHISCFACTQCQINLQGKPFYALENKPYCEEDYLNTLEKCSVCMKPILERILRATGKPYHPQCFTCVVCGNSLDGIPFTVDATNQNYCIQDFHKKFAPRCSVCKEPIMPDPGQEETVRVVALDRSFHLECYKCEDCGLLLSSEAEGRGCYPLDDHILCKSCNAKRVQMLTNSC